MTPNYRNSIASLLLVVTLLAGCASAGTEIDQSATTQIQKGVTTKQQVIALLGAPMGDTLSFDGKEMMFWSYSQTRIKGATFIPVYGLFAGGANMRTTMFQVILGPDKIVQDYLWSDSNIDSRVGH